MMKKKTKKKRYYNDYDYDENNKTKGTTNTPQH